jgi:cellulose synthase operon protein C
MQRNLSWHIGIVCLFMLCMGQKPAYAFLGWGGASSSPVSVQADRFAKEAKDSLEKQNYRDAIVAFRQSLQFNPDQPDVRLDLVKVYLQFSDALSAEKELRFLLEKAPTNETAQILLGKAFLMQKRPESVFKNIDLIGSTLDIKHQKIELHAQAALQQKDTLNAKSAYEKIIAEDPLSQRGYYGLADLAYRSGRFSEANTLLDKVFAQNPHHVQALTLKGQIALIQGQIYAADALFQKALSHDAYALEAACTHIQVLLQDGQMEEAQSALNKLEDAYPNHPYILYLRAFIQYKRGNFTQAESHYTKISETLKDYPPALMLGSLIKYRVGAYRQSAQWLLDYNVLMPQDYTALLSLGYTYLKMGDNKGALTQFKTVLGKEGVKSNKTVFRSALRGQISAFVRDEHYEEAYTLMNSFQQDTLGDKGDKRHEEESLEGAQIRSLVALLCGQDESETDQTACTPLERKKPQNQTLVYLKDLIQNQDLNTAGRRIEQLSMIEKTDPRMAIVRADYKIASQEYEAAKVLLNEVLSKEPFYLSALQLIEKIDILQDKREESLNRLERLSDQYPQNLDLLLMRSLRYEEEGHPEKSSALLEQKKDLFPQSIAFLEERVRLFLQAHTPDKAVPLLDEIDKLLQDPVKRRSLATAYEQAGAFEKAASILEKLGDAPFKIGVLYARSGQKEKALEVARSFKGTPLEKTFLEGDILVQLKHFIEASRLLDKALEVSSSPDNRLLLKRYTLYSLEGKHGDASTFLAKWVEKRPQDETLLKAYADDLLKQKKYEEAYNTLKTLLDKNPISSESVDILNNLALVSLERSSPTALSEASAYAEKAYTLNNGKDARILETFGWVLFKAGRKEQALDLLQRAVQLGDPSQDRQYHYAVVLDDMGNKETALSVLEDIFQDPSFSDIKFENKKDAQALKEKILTQIKK